jgi:hypothetical protein
MYQSVLSWSCQSLPQYKKEKAPLVRPRQLSGPLL